jgi:hypothetical protein
VPDGDGALACIRRVTSGLVVTTMSLCSRRSPTPGGSWTTLTYQWEAGDVTYESDVTSVSWCLWLPCTPEMHAGSYHWNTTTYSSTGTRVLFGDDFRIATRFESGAYALEAEALLVIRPLHSGQASPLACWSEGVIRGGQFGLLQRCEQTTDEVWSMWGFGPAPTGVD